jgi:hypothetical protein
MDGNVKVSDRANIVSSYTIVKGSMIEESYTVLAAWDFAQSKKRNMDRLRRENFIEAKSDSWLRDVAKVFNRRFDPAGRDRALAILAKSGCDLEEWKPLLLWHLTRDEFLLKDFLIHWLFPTCYDSSAHCVQHEDLQIYLRNIGKRGGSTEHAWTGTTSHRVATALLRIAADFGLLKGSKEREFASYHLPERSFIYLLHALLDQYKSPGKVINAVEWRMFLLCPSDVERELLRLHQSGKIKYDGSGNSVQFSLPCKNSEEYAERISKFAPGNRCEVSYTDDKIEWLDIKTDMICQAHVFLGVLGFSQLIFATASENEEGPNLVQGHRKMFDAFGGVPEVTVCARLKQGVTKTRRYPDMDPGYAEIAAHYMTTVVPAKSGHSKSQALIDGAERIVMRAFHFIYRRHTFTSIAEINYALSHLVDRINRKNYQRSKISRLERWATQEKHALKSLPAVAFDAVEWKLARVHSDCTVSLESAYYSVPHQHQGKKVRIKLSSSHVEIYVDQECVALHERDFARRAIRHVIPEHLPDNAKAYREVTPQKLLSQARFIAESLYSVIEELFAQDTLGNLRRAERLIRRAQIEIRDYGRENAHPRLHVAIEQMRQFNNFRVHYFEATLQQLRQNKRSGYLNGELLPQCPVKNFQESHLAGTS